MLRYLQVEWQEACGVGAAGTARQGLRLLHSRVLTAALTTAPAPDGAAGGGSNQASTSASAQVRILIPILGRILFGDACRWPQATSEAVCLTTLASESPY